MLQNLHIENYALIEKLNIDFSEGLSVITGETGAGKSIMLGALALILGKRADTKVLMDENRKCVIEGRFEIEDYALESFFDKRELDFDKISYLRREITPSGKSRAFINDTPVNLAVLKELGDKLVNIHSQHETITLNNANFQLAVLDSYAGHDELLNSYQKLFKDYKRNLAELTDLQSMDTKAKSDQDYWQFQYDELEKANLKQDEQESLEEELNVLSHAEEIKSGMNEVVHKLDESELAILDQLDEVLRVLNKLSTYHPEVSHLNDRLNSCLIEMKDISRELCGIEDSVSLDPVHLSEINERLNLIYALQQKHRKQNNTELLVLQEELEKKLRQIDSAEEEIKSLKLKIKEQEEELNNKAQELSANRHQKINEIEDNIVENLQKLGMPDARFQILQQPLAELGNEGIDKISFLFNANKGAKLSEVNRIASGGELSRLMLVIKSIISNKKLLPTIIFDEIDMGVSGEVADKVGAILSKMSQTMQVVAITHLPQIAVKGKSHFKVFKDNQGDIAKSKIIHLDKDERIIEIAKMLSGAEVTKSAIENAKVLLSKKA